MAVQKTNEGKSLGRNSEVVRQHNLSTVLRLVHRNQEISRSQLAQITGLNRSTISDLVEELSQMRLVYEGQATIKEGVGRPSLMVHASENLIAYSVHPEYDFLAVAAVTFAGQILQEERMSHAPGISPQQVAKEAARLIARLAEQLPENSRVVGVGIAVPGQIRFEDGTVRLAPHLGWVDVPIVDLLEKEIGLPCYVDNDASLGCMAESVFGAARGFTDVIYIFGGSGVGGGVISGGVQLRGATGCGSELGHVRISSSENPDYSGIPGTLESIVRREDLVASLKLKGADDQTLESTLLANRSLPVRELVEKQIDALAIAIANYANIFNPQIVVLAGFLPALYWYDQERLLGGLSQGALPASREGLIVRTGELGANILTIGAAELPFAALIAAPSQHPLNAPGAKVRAR